MAEFSYSVPNLGAAQIAGVQEQQELLLGKDIMFNGDYKVTAAGDYVLLSGLEALRQAVYRRLLTRPGEYKLRPEYGVGVQDFVKRRNLPATTDLLKQRIVDQLSFDERIAEVKDVVVERITDGLRIGIVIKAAGETLKFQPFDFKDRTTLGTLTNASGGLRIGG